MRSVIRTAVLLAGACLVFVGTAANAGASPILAVKVPFQFVVNGQSFPAGEYTVVQDDESPSVLFIRGEKGNHAAGFVLTEPAGGPDPAGSVPALSFTRYENQYRLSSLWESSREGWIVMGR